MKTTVILYRGRSYTDERQKMILLPLSLVSLAAVLKDYNAIILDGNVLSEEDCFERIRYCLDDVLCVGISSLTGPEIASGLKFAAFIRNKVSHIPIVWGGWHVSCLPEESIQNEYVDAIVVGLGQKVFPEIVKRIHNGKSFNDVDGVLSMSEGGQVRFNQYDNKESLLNVPLPAFDMLDLELYRRESMSLLPYPSINGLKLTGYAFYVTSFGCPFSCGFCSNNLVFKHRWYGYSVDTILDQLGWLITEKGFNCISIIDAEFFFKNDRVEYFCDGIIKRGYKFAWDAQSSVKSILRMAKKGLLSKLHKAGCWRMNIGSETGSAEMLNYINKKIRVEDIYECASAVRDSGITGCFNFLFGLPPEKLSDVMDSFSMAYNLKKTNPNSPLAISFYTPFPGTPIYQDAIKAGFIVPETLEEWGSYKTSYVSLSENIPWRKKEREKLIYDVLTFYLPVAVPGNMKRGTITTFKEKLRKSPYRKLLYLFHKIADRRMRNMFFGFRFERMIFDLYCKLFRKPQYMSGKWEIDDDD